MKIVKIFTTGPGSSSSDSVYLIGGFQDGCISTKTWIVNPDDFHVSQGPSLTYERCRHSCGKMIINEKVILVVAGGTGANETGDSVEFLDTSSDQGWVLGEHQTSFFKRL